MSPQNNTLGHLLALCTIILWGTTFISTKVLLKDFTPVEILFFRFTLGYRPAARACCIQQATAGSAYARNFTSPQQDYAG